MDLMTVRSADDGRFEGSIETTMEWGSVSDGTLPSATLVAGHPTAFLSDGFVPNIVIAIGEQEAPAVQGDLIATRVGTQSDMSHSEVLSHVLVGDVSVAQLSVRVTNHDGVELFVVCSAADHQWPQFAAEFDHVIGSAKVSQREGTEA